MAADKASKAAPSSSKAVKKPPSSAAVHKPAVKETERQKEPDSIKGKKPKRGKGHASQLSAEKNTVTEPSAPVPQVQIATKPQTPSTSSNRPAAQAPRSPRPPKAAHVKVDAPPKPPPVIAKPPPRPPHETPTAIPRPPKIDSTSNRSWPDKTDPMKAASSKAIQPASDVPKTQSSDVGRASPDPSKTKAEAGTSVAGVPRRSRPFIGLHSRQLQAALNGAGVAPGERRRRAAVSSDTPFAASSEAAGSIVSEESERTSSTRIRKDR